MNFFVKNVFIFGNHSTTQVAHISNGIALLPDGSEIPLPDLLEGQGDPLKSDYKYILHTVQNRGAEIIKKMQVNSALSAAEAIGKVVLMCRMYMYVCMLSFHPNEYEYKSYFYLSLLFLVSSTFEIGSGVALT